VDHGIALPIHSTIGRTAVMYGYIYLTTNIENQKQYIGRHKGVFTSSYLGSGVALKHSIIKYGEDSFSVFPIFFAYTNEDLNIAERHFIDEYGAVDNKNFYNIMPGGHNSGKSKTRSQSLKLYYENNPNQIERHKKISRSQVGLPGPRLGSKHTQKTKDLMSVFRTGNPTCWSEWKLIYKNGDVVEISNLKKWCADNNVKHNSLRNTLSKPDYFYKGLFRVERN